MIGKLDPNEREVSVIGGGIAGLLISKKLLKEGYSVTLYEKNDRLGGMISTREVPEGIAEAAAHSLLVSTPVRELFQELGVPLTPLKKEASARWIFRDGKCRRFPLRFLEILELLFRATFVRAKKDWNRISLEAWGQRHLGNGATRFLLAPFVQGIYGCKTSELSVLAAFPKLVVPRGRTLFSNLLFFGKGVRRGKKPLMAPTHGMGSLIQALEKSLRAHPKMKINLGHEISALPNSINIVFSTDLHSTAKVLLPTHPELSKLLMQVPHAPLVSVTAFFHTRDFASEPQGVGVLIPESENIPCLGILYNSSAFEERVKSPEMTSLTFLFGNDEEIETRIQTTLSRLHFSNPKPVRLVIHRWERAIPLYGPALEKVWQRTQGKDSLLHLGLAFFSNWCGEVSVRGMVEKTF